ncbi:uncharacterized protein LOC120343374 [Styela clava]
MICSRAKIKVRFAVLGFSLTVFIFLASEKCGTLRDKVTRDSFMKEVDILERLFPFLRPHLSNPDHKRSDLPITNSINVPRSLGDRENIFSPIFVSKTAVKKEEDNNCDIDRKRSNIESHVWDPSVGSSGISRTRPQNVNDQDCSSGTGNQQKDFNRFETNFDSVDPCNSTTIKDNLSADLYYFKANLTNESDFNDDVVVNVSDLQKFNETIPQSRHYIFQNDTQVFHKSVAKINKLSVWRNNSDVTYEFPMSPEGRSHEKG